jgi:hypothetical protein
MGASQIAFGDRVIMNKTTTRLPRISAALLTACLGVAVLAHADERRFTYTYEPELPPKGGLELEQWVTLRTQRTSGGEVQQENYNLWEIREELEYGVTDNYSVSLYLNTSAESLRDTSQSPGVDRSEFRFDGVSVENRYMLLNPANHAVGLTLYLEPRFSGSEAEIEQKIILGQRHGDWKWALNLTHATEWADNLHTTEGEVEASFGITRDLGKRWSLGFEVRDHNELPDYRIWENTAVFAGPVVSYRQEKWWAALTVMPQVYGANFSGDPDHNHRFELEGHERVNIRLLFGISL